MDDDNAKSLPPFPQPQAQDGQLMFDAAGEAQRRVIMVYTPEDASAHAEMLLSGRKAYQRRERVLSRLEKLGNGTATAMLKDQLTSDTFDVPCQFTFPLSELAQKGGSVSRDIRQLVPNSVRGQIAAVAGHVGKIEVTGGGHNTPFAQLLFESCCARETAAFATRNPSLFVQKTLAAQGQTTQTATTALARWEMGAYLGLCDGFDMRTALKDVIRKELGAELSDFFSDTEKRADERREKILPQLRERGWVDFESPDAWYSCGMDIESHFETRGSGLSTEVLYNSVVNPGTKDGGSFVLAHSLVGTYLLRDTAHNLLVFPGQPEVVAAKNPRDPKKTSPALVLPMADSYFLYAPKSVIKEAVHALTSAGSLHAQLMKATYRSLASIKITVRAGEAESGVYVPAPEVGGPEGHIAIVFQDRVLGTLRADYPCVINLKLRIPVLRNRTVTHARDYSDRLVIAANPLMHNSWPQGVFAANSLVAPTRANLPLNTLSLVRTQAQLSKFRNESLAIMSQIAKKRTAAVESGVEITDAFDESVRLAHEHAERTGEIYTGDLPADTGDAQEGAAAAASSSSSSAVPVEDD